MTKQEYKDTLYMLQDRARDEAIKQGHKNAENKKVQAICAVELFKEAFKGLAMPLDALLACQEYLKEFA